MNYKILSTYGVVTDKTAQNLKDAGWKCLDGWLWIDPRTTIQYAISQAEAIRRDRINKKYRFRS